MRVKRESVQRPKHYTLFYCFERVLKRVQLSIHRERAGDAIGRPTGPGRIVRAPVIIPNQSSFSAILYPAGPHVKCMDTARSD